MCFEQLSWVDFFFHVDMLLNTLVSDFYNFPLEGPCTVDPKSHRMVNTWSDIVKIIANDMIDVWLWFKMMGPPNVKWHDLTIVNVITFVIFGLVPSFWTIDPMNEIFDILAVIPLPRHRAPPRWFHFFKPGDRKLYRWAFREDVQLVWQHMNKNVIFLRNMCEFCTRIPSPMAVCFIHPLLKKK